jgi:hypothetical protein
MREAGGQLNRREDVQNGEQVLEYAQPGGVHGDGPYSFDTTNRSVPNL